VEVTDVKVKLVSDKADKLKAFCTITLDGEFVIRDIKVIKGARGYFVAMPSRKLMDRCPSCGGKNHLRAAYCNECGGSLRPNRVSHDTEGRAKLHADIAHPINSACRERLQGRIVEGYEREIEESRKPGYVPASDDDLLEDDLHPFHKPEQDAKSAEPVEAEVDSPPPSPSEPKPEPDSFSSGII